MELKTLVLFALVASSFAGPIPDSQCSTECVDSGNLNYEKGRAYTYRYRSITSSWVNGTSAYESSGLDLSCDAEIQVISKCEMVLRLRNADLVEIVPGKDRMPPQNVNMFREKLEDTPLRFSFQNGVVSELCTESEEDTWALNIKRSILSTFQTTFVPELFDSVSQPRTITETDITGTCQTTFVVEQKSGQTFIRKTKDLNRCSDRQTVLSAVQSTPISQIPRTQTLVNSTLYCEHQIDDRRVQYVTCKERHIARPFSNQTSGAITKVRVNMELVDITESARPGPMVRHRSSLKFQHSRKVEQEQSFHQLESIMAEVCQNIQKDIRPETAAYFTRIVRTMRSVDYSGLQTVFSRLTSSNFCGSRTETASKFFLDAIPLVGTTNSVRFMKQMIESQSLPETLTNSWISSLHFIQNPTKEMIGDIKTLAQKMPSKNTFLALSTLIHTYCEYENQDCTSVSEVVDALRMFEGELGWQCNANNPQETEQIIMSLKAIGNSGRVLNARSILSRCIREDGNPIEIRVAAIEAFRRMSCNPNTVNDMMEVFSDRTVDSELRIASYLGAMRCPTHNLLRRIQTTMQNEEINQVNSFVWSHLYNLDQSSDPCKMYVRLLVKDLNLVSKFNMEDARKFSRNFELSAYSNKDVNVGGTIESNVIFSTKSYIPRSAMVNLTANIFGHSINLFEIGGRLEGMEYFFESFFGPNGYFPENNALHLLQNPMGVDPRQQMPESNKAKRSLIEPNQLDTLDSRVGNIKTDNRPHGSVYMKMFGNEINYQEFNSVDMLKPEKASVEMMMMMKLMSKMAENQEVELTKNAMFLETSFVIPTLAGMPLSIAINGSTSLNLKVGGKMDLRSFIGFPSARNLDITGSLRPSGVVEVASEMTVDAFVARTGLRTVSTLHSSVVLDGSVTLSSSEDFKVRLNVPKESQEIINVESKVFIVNTKFPTELQGIRENRRDMKMCSGPWVENRFGVRFCSQLTYPNASQQYMAPFFPLTGPASFRVTLDKVDPSLTSFDMQLMYKNKPIRVNGVSQKVETVRLMVGTPGTTIPRSYSVDVTLNRMQRNLNITLVHPQKQVQIWADLVNTTDTKRANLRVVVDESTEYSTSFQMDMVRGGSVDRYSPLLTVSLPMLTPITAGGVIEVNKQMPKRTIDIQMSLKHLLTTHITLKGILTDDQTVIGNRKMLCDFSFDHPMLKSTLTAGATTDYMKNLNTTIQLTYTPITWNTQSFTFTNNFINHSTEFKRSYKWEMKNELTQFPQYQTEMEMSWINSGHEIEAMIKGCLDKKMCTSNHNVISKLHLKNSTTSEVNGYYGNLAVDLPGQETINFNYEHTNTNKVVDCHLNIQGLTRSAPIVVVLNLQNNTQLRGVNDNMQGSIKIDMPERQMRLQHTYSKKNDFNTWLHTVQTIMQWQQDSQFVLDVVYKNDSTYNNHQVEATVTLPDQETVKMETGIQLTQEPTEFLTNFKLTLPSQNAYIFDLSYKNKSDLASTEHDLVVTLDTPMHLFRDLRLGVNLQNTSTLYSSEVELRYAPSKQFTLKTTYENSTSFMLSHHSVKVEANMPNRDLVVDFFVHNTPQTQSASKLELTYKNKNDEETKMSVEVGYTNNTDIIKCQHEFWNKWTMPGRTVDIGLILENTTRHYMGQFNVEWEKDRKMQVNVTYDNDSHSSETSHEASLEVRMPQSQFSVGFNHQNTSMSFIDNLEVMWGQEELERIFFAENIYQRKFIQSDYGTVLRHEISTRVTCPLMTTQLTTNAETSPKVFILDLELTNDDESKMKLTTKLINSSSPSNCEYKAGFTLASELFPDNDLEFNFKWENTSIIYSLDTDFSWQHDKKVEVTFDYKIPRNTMAESFREITFVMKNPLDIDNPFKAIDLNLNAKRKLHHSGKMDYSGKFDLEWGRRLGDQKLVLEGKYSNETDSEMMNTHVFSLDIQQPLELPLVPQTPSFQFVLKRKPMDVDAKFTYGWKEGKEMTTQVLYVNKMPSHDFKLIFNHPSLSHDVQLHSLNTIKKEENVLRLFGTRNQIIYSDDKNNNLNFNFNITLAPITTPSTFNHSYQLELTHLSNGVDISSQSHVGNNPKEITYGSHVFFKNDGVYRKVNVFLQINKQQKSLLLQTTSPELMPDVEIKARFINESTPIFPKYSVQINNTYDHQRRIRTSLCLDGEMRQVQAKCHWNPENPEDYMRLRARMVNESALEAKISHKTNGVHFVDALVNTRLNTSELLHSRVHWRPQSWTELANQMKYALYRINRTMETINRYSADKCYKWSTWRKDLYYSFRMENEYFFNEMKKIQIMMNIKMEELRNYQLPTMERENMNWEMWETFVGYFQRLNIDDIAKENWDDWTESMKSEWSQFRQAWQYFNQTEIQPFIREMRENWKQISILASQDRQELKTYWQNVVDERKVSWNEFQEEMEGLWIQKKETLDRKIEVIRQRMQSIHQSNLENIENSNRMIKTNFDSWNGEMKQKWQSFGDEFKARWGQVAEYERLAFSQELERIREIPNAIYQEAKWAVKYWHVKERMQRMITRMLTSGLKMLSWYTNRSTCYPTVMNPQQGEVQVECMLPFKLPSFTQVPDMSTQQWYNTIFNPNYTFAQVYHAYKPSTNPKNWIPPFPTTGMLIGNQGYQTFDKTFYEFSGSCSYLLARDFVNDNFSVIVNYQRDFSNNLRKSLTVISQGQEIEIGNDKSVVLNGQTKELPVQVSNITITRIGNLISMYNKLGLGITCDLQHNNCMVEISGWYFGKTRGMFGLYNNEQLDDQRTPYNEAPSTIELLARSWEVSTQCSSHTNMAQKCQQNSSNRKHFEAECQRAFFASDEMKPCFAMVDPKPFIEMCINAKCSSSLNKNVDSQKALCNVISAYSMSCRQKEIVLDLPHQCVTCEKPNGSIFLSNETLSLTSENIPRSADIMVVVEEKTCNKLTADRLPALIKEINTELKSRDVTNNRFGLMGYGGSGVHTMEHSHTVSNNQLFGDANDFQAGVESLEFSETSTNNDTFRAIHAAANYPFRAGVAKTIILLTCSECKPGQTEMYYNEISKLLLNYGISLNIIVDQNIVAVNKKDQEIFGYDSKAVFTSKIRDYFGDKTLRNYIMTPTSMCTRLAQETNGTVFDSSKMDQKAFVSVFAPRFAEHSTPYPCQVCQCMANQFIQGQTVCRPCHQLVPATFQEPLHKSTTSMDVYKSFFSQKTEKYDLSSSKKLS